MWQCVCLPGRWGRRALTIEGNFVNRIYRLVWSNRQQKFVVTHEKVRARGRSGGSIVGAGLLTGLLGSAMAAPAAGTLPDGGQVTAGSATISVNANTMTVQQSTQRAAINWQGFSIGAGGTVNFQQPNAAAVTLNRVVGNEQSVIAGAMNANGQLYLLNANGVLFAQGAQVNVGGLVASTLNLSDADFMAGRTTFSGSGSGRVINFGSLTARDGGYVALLGNQVKNEGSITARVGSAILAAGERVSLNFNGDSLVGVSVDKGSLESLVENKQAIRADGGLVILTAKGLDTVLSGLVNNSGEIRAQTVVNKEGRILLLGDMTSGSVQVSGKLDASAPDGGNGGFIETSAARIQIADEVKITTLAPGGKTGEWLIDPYNVTISNAISSGMGGFNGNANDSVLNVTTLANALASTGVTVTTGVGGSQAGNITVDAPISWSANTVLALNAAGSILINKDITATGNNAGLSLSYSGGYSLNKGARVTLSGRNASLSMAGTGYTLIHDIGALQGITSTGFYALANDIDASSTASWNAGAGFNPLDGVGTNFAGLGHSIDKLTINRGQESDVALFRTVSGNVRDLTLSNASINGQLNVAGVAANLGGTLSNVHLTGIISGSGAFVGGLAGTVYNGLIRYSSSAADVTGLTVVGGLAGSVSSIAIADSYSTGSVTATVSNTSAFAGGLLGEVISSATLTNTYASGKVTGYTATGGLVGGGYLPTITVNNSYWDVNSTGQSSSRGGGTGLSAPRNQASYVGLDFTNTWVMFEGNTRPMLRNEYSTTIFTPHALQLMGLDLSASYRLGSDLSLTAALAGNAGSYGEVWGASGFVPIGNSPQQFTGSFDGQGHSIMGLAINRAATNYVGLFGYTSGASLSNVTLTGGSITGADGVGALVGYMLGGTLANAAASANVNGTSSGEANTGGLVGTNDGGAIADASASGNVNGAGYQVGGLVGFNVNGGSITRSYASGDVTGTNSSVGGYIGGLVGGNGYSGDGGAISQSYATGTVRGAGGPIGGFVGHNEGSITDSYASGAVIGQGAASNIGGFAGVNFINGTISNSYATGYVEGNQSGGFVGYNNGVNGAISNAYWNTQTSGQLQGTAGGLASGMTGRSTAQLQGSLPTGFASSIWGISSNLYPYLTWRYSTTPHAVSGQVFSDAGSTALAGATVAAVSGGQLIGSASSGANGYYYVLGAASQFDSNGAITYLAGSTTKGAAFSDVSGINGIQGLDLHGSSVRLVTGQAGLSATRNRYLGARGSYSAADLAFFAPSDFSALTSNGYGLSLTASATSFSLDTDLGSGGLLSLDSGGTFIVSGTRHLSAGGNLNLADRLAWTDNAALILSTTSAGNIVLGDGIHAANGSLTISAGGSVSSTGDVNLGVLNFNGGSWIQVAATLPGLSVTDFRLGSSATFVRAIGGDGSAATPYRIADVYGLQGLASAGLGGTNFVLAGDIAASGSASWNSGTGFVPAGSLANPFTGRLDGQGHRISGLVINRPGSTYSGLFGYNAGYVGNLYLAGGSVDGGTYSAALVGYNASTGVVERVSSDVSVTGTGNVGALAGSNAGSISQSLASGNVSGGLNGGGLAGSNASTGTISDSYATGSVQGSATAGGLVGFNDGGLLRVYATGNAASAGGAAGGLVGSNVGTISGSFWNTTTSSSLIQGVGAGNASGVAGLTGTQLTSLASFTAAGWSIDNAGGTGATWRIYEGHSAPLLRTFLTSLTLSAGSASKTYDGNANSAAGTLVFPVGYDSSLVSGNAFYTASSANAGTYTGANLRLDGLYSSQFGYDIEMSGGSLTINKATLTITPNDQIRRYGDANPVFAQTVTGFTNGEDLSVLGGTLGVGSSTATAASAAGRYVISGNATGLSSINYDFNIGSGTLTIVDGPASPAAAVTASGTTDGSATNVLGSAPDLTGANRAISATRTTATITVIDDNARRKPPQALFATSEASTLFTVVEEGVRLPSGVAR
ncbi:filamentous hemagglutinin N-terminal domain-containing protein [Herbaspirillum sp. RU 5E]|nr:filamentous hemagglutinin N-terminal domain-containing protein [Herbaspirillum sp. RU 5E]